MAKERRYDISVLRVVSMLMIILCHIIKNYTFIPFSNHLSEVFNAGVYIFLGISGYLFAMKDINDYKHWFLRRIKRIYIPVTILVMIDVVFLLVLSRENVTIRQFLVYILNIQGLMFINWNLFSEVLGGEIANLGQLWFLTVIMLCYILVPVLNYVKKRLGTNWSKYLILLLSSVIISSLLEYYTGFHLYYFVTFICGFFLSIFHSNGNKYGKFSLIIGLISILLQFGRLLFRSLGDNTSLYYAYISISHCFLGISILIIYTELYLYKPKLFNFGKSRIIQEIDIYSLYIYMTHRLFCSKPWNMYEQFRLMPATLLFILLSVLSAIVLKNISEKFTFLTNKFCNNNCSI